MEGNAMVTSSLPFYAKSIFRQKWMQIRNLSLVILLWKGISVLIQETNLSNKTTLKWPDRLRKTVLKRWSMTCNFPTTAKLFWPVPLFSLCSKTKVQVFCFSYQINKKMINQVAKLPDILANAFQGELPPGLRLND